MTPRFNIEPKIQIFRLPLVRGLSEFADLRDLDKNVECID